MAKIISLFNHKGGVGKTTFAYNLAFALIKQNKKVLLIDGDSQMNLTGFVTGFYNKESNAMNSLFESKTITDFYSVHDYFSSKIFFNQDNQNELKKKELLFNKVIYTKNKTYNLSLLCGDMETAQFDIDFNDIKTSQRTSQHLPGAFQNALNEVSNNFDYTIIDLSPNLGFFNMFCVMASDYFIVPIMPNYFSLQASLSIKSAFQKWNMYISPYRKSDVVKNGIDVKVKFLGFVSQNFRPYDNNNDGVVYGFKEWEEAINEKMSLFSEYLFSSGMSIEKKEFEQYFPNESPYCIGRTSDFNRLGRMCEKYNIPISCLTYDILDKDKNNKDQLNSKDISDILEFDKIYNTIAEGICRLK